MLAVTSKACMAKTWQLCLRKLSTVCKRIPSCWRNMVLELAQIWEKKECAFRKVQQYLHILQATCLKQDLLTSNVNSVASIPLTQDVMTQLVVYWRNYVVLYKLLSIFVVWNRVWWKSSVWSSGCMLCLTGWRFRSRMAISQAGSLARPKGLWGMSNQGFHSCCLYLIRTTRCFYESYEAED